MAQACLHSFWSDLLLCVIYVLAPLLLLCYKASQTPWPMLTPVTAERKLHCLWPLLDPSLWEREGRSAASGRYRPLLALSTKSVASTFKFQIQSFLTGKQFPLANILACNWGLGVDKEKLRTRMFFISSPREYMDISLTIIFNFVKE